MFNSARPEDCLWAMAIFQVFGLKYLQTATDGMHFGAVRIQTNKRWACLWVGLAIIWLPYLGCWIGWGHSPVELFQSVSLWWNDAGPIGKIIAVAFYWLLLSPLQGLLAVSLILRQEERERKAMKTRSIVS